MNLLQSAKEKFIYLAVLVLLILVLAVLYVYWAGGMDVEAAKMYLQALTGVATLALLYYAYFNVASKKEEDIATLELAVRPILTWEIESSDGGALLTYKTIKHPIYDMHVMLTLGGAEQSYDERHLDVFEAHPGSERKYDVTKFITEGLNKDKMKILHISFSYHSEVGGRYEFAFTKEVVKKSHGFLFQHRKIIYAKYPWRKEEVQFTD
ncbi:Uncharacterised protein [uncultured archaeon]|nr:Uncharacterised protein [uncultured archaeon]